MRVVIDCNVIISAGMTAGNCRQVIFEVARFHDALFSLEIFREYVSVSGRDKFRGSRAKLTEILQLLLWNSSLVHPVPCGIALPDKKDEMYLHAAISSQADAIITGNKKDFPEPAYRGVRILSPQEFLGLTHS
jgi:putative PIN family toxin of toxin-antitoxin system